MQYFPAVVALRQRYFSAPYPADSIVQAVSLNYRDLEVISGQYHEIFPAGQVPLLDGAGEVVECGSRVSG